MRDFTDIGGYSDKMKSLQVTRIEKAALDVLKDYANYIKVSTSETNIPGQYYNLRMAVSPPKELPPLQHEELNQALASFRQLIFNTTQPHYNGDYGFDAEARLDKQDVSAIVSFMTQNGINFPGSSNLIQAGVQK